MALTNSVFISYRRQVGGVWALAVYQHLTGHGIDAFFDVEGLRQSGQFNAKLLNQIASRPYFLLVLTPGTLSRCREPGDWLRREIDHALATKRIIIPLHTPNFDYGDFDDFLPPEAAAQLSAFQGLELNQTYFMEAFRRLTDDFLEPVPADDVLISTEDEEHRKAVEELANMEPAVTTERIRAQDLFLRGYDRADSEIDAKVADYTGAIGLDPSYARAFFQRGVALEATGDARRALADFEEAARLDPADTDAPHEAHRLALALAPQPSPLLRPRPPRPADDEDRRRRRRRLLVGAAATLVALALVVALVLAFAGGGGGGTTGPTSSGATSDTAPPGTGETTVPDRLQANGTLQAGQRLQSADGRHTLEMSEEGELVAATDGGEWWRQPADAPPGAVAVMQEDGNLVVYRSPSQLSPADAQWSTGTHNHPGAYLVVEEADGFGLIAIRAPDGAVLWDESGRPAPDLVLVPDVHGLTRRAAFTRLDGVGFDVSTSERASSELAAGLAIGTDPAAGTELAPGSPVELIVSTGTTTVDVPNVVGATSDEAIHQLEAAGLAWDAIPRAGSGQPAGTVVAQNPAGGASVAAGSTVTIEVAAGPPPTTAPPPPKTTIGL